MSDQTTPAGDLVPPYSGTLRVERVRARMAELGLTGHALELVLRERYGVRVNVYRLLAGRRPSLDTLVALANALGCGLDDLWDREG